MQPAKGTTSNPSPWANSCGLLWWVNPPELPPALLELPQPDGDEYSPSYMPDGEEDDHLYDDVEEPLEICPNDVVEKLHAPQGGAEVQVHVSESETTSGANSGGDSPC